jgi:mono/diheme cytochrome c family protein
MFHNFKIYILVIITALTTFSCGPRSGIHNDDNDLSEENKHKESQFVCGNAVQEEINNNWANNTLGLTGDRNNGRKLFKQNCAVCHSLNDQKLTGSGLYGVYDRVPEPKLEWLKKYILNSEKVYKSGDKYARKLHKASGGALMTNFEEYLSDQEINDVLLFVLSNGR